MSPASNQHPIITMCPPDGTFQCCAGDAVTVRQHLETGSSPNAVGPSRRPPLFLAAVMGRGAVCRCLLDAKADPTWQAEGIKEYANGSTALHQAAREGNLEAVMEITSSKAAADAEASSKTDAGSGGSGGDKSQQPPDPIRGANTDVEKTSGWTVKQLLQIRDAKGATPLSLAAEKGHHKVVAQLLAYGAEGGEGAARTKGLSPILHAALNGHLETLEALRDGGVPLDAEGYGGATPLYVASQRGHEACVR